VNIEALVEMADRHQPSYKSLGYNYVAVFRHMDHERLCFIEPYKTWEQYAAARKRWMAADFVVRKMFDLDYDDYIREQNV